MTVVPDHLKAIPEVIYTPRLIISPMKPADALLIYRGLREAWGEMQKHVSWAGDFDNPNEITKGALDTTAQYQKYLNRTDFYMKAVDRKSHQFVCSVTLWGVNWDKMSIGLGYWTPPSNAGQGYTTEAATALVKYGFDILKLKEFNAFCNAGHLVSQKILTNLGFVYESTEKGAYVMALDGRVLDRKNYVLKDRRRLPDLAVSWE